MKTISPIYSITVLINLIGAVALGILLRLAFLHEIPFQFNHLLHAHSHLASLGWIHQGITLLLIYFFTTGMDKTFKTIFWITQISVIGMTFSFPFQGYGSFSIPFAAFHIICSYFFIGHFFKTKLNLGTNENFILKTSLLFMIISTLGIWLLGPSIILFGKNSEVYHFMIQFYLHFQFEGFYLPAILVLLFRSFSIDLNQSSKKWILFYLVTIIIGVFNLLSRHLNLEVFNIPDYLSIVIKSVFGIMLLWMFGRKLIYLLISKKNFLLNILSLFFIVKLVIPIFLLYPDLFEKSFMFRNFVIGYLHLNLLGIVSTGILLAFLYLKWTSDKSNLNSYLFSIGVGGTIILLFAQAIFVYLKWLNIPYFQEILLLFGAITFTSTLIFLIEATLKNHLSINEKKKNNKNRSLNRDQIN